MKNFTKLLGIITLAVIIGFLTTGCPIDTVPDAPVIKYVNSSTTVTIYWSAVKDATEYKVYARPRTGGATTADPNSFIYQLTTQETNAVFKHEGYSYFFAVKAVNSVGESGFSNVIYN
jgi:hypothetical protein